MVSKLEIQNAQLRLQLRRANETLCKLSAATTALMQATYRLDRAERADERRAGAIWGVMEMARNFGEYAIGGDPAVPKAIKMCEDVAAAIERGDVEVPC